MSATSLHARRCETSFRACSRKNNEFHSAAAVHALCLAPAVHQGSCCSVWAPTRSGGLTTPAECGRIFSCKDRRVLRLLLVLFSHSPLLSSSLLEGCPNTADCSHSRTLSTRAKFLHLLQMESPDEFSAVFIVNVGCVLSNTHTRTKCCAEAASSCYLQCSVHALFSPGFPQVGPQLLVSSAAHTLELEGPTRLLFGPADYPYRCSLIGILCCTFNLRQPMPDPPQHNLGVATHRHTVLDRRLPSLHVD